MIGLLLRGAWGILRGYFMTVAPVNPNDGLKVGEHTCANTAPTGCDVQAIHRP